MEVRTPLPLDAGKNVLRVQQVVLDTQEECHSVLGQLEVCTDPPKLPRHIADELEHLVA